MDKPTARGRRWIRVVFLLLLPLLGLQFAYGLLVREPYPAIIMPAFAKIKASGDTVTTIRYELRALTSDDALHQIPLDTLMGKLSGLGTRLTLERMLFGSQAQRGNSSLQSKYTRLAGEVLGQQFLEHVAQQRYRPVGAAETRAFQSWLWQRTAALYPDLSIEQLTVERRRVTRRLRTRELLDDEVIQRRTLER